MKKFIKKTRQKSTLCGDEKAKCKEIHALLRRGTLRTFLKEKVPADANIFPGHFVLAIKYKLEGQIKYRDRFVVGGRRDKLKDLIVYSSQMLHPKSIRVLLTVSVLFKFDIRTTDVSQAYL